MNKTLLGVLVGGAVAVGASYLYREQLKNKLLAIIEKYQFADNDEQVRNSSEFKEAVAEYEDRKENPGVQLYPETDKD